MPWESDPTIRRLTKTILALDRRGAKAVVETYVEIGHHLIAARDRLERGQFQRWIEATLPYGPRAAQRYVTLALWADAHRAELRRMQHLGLSKVLRLIAIEPERRAALPLTGAIAIPGTDHKKPLGAMSIAELDAVIGGFTTGTRAHTTPVTKVVQAFRHRVAAVDAWATELIARADEVDPDVIADARTELQGVLDELDATFGDA